MALKTKVKAGRINNLSDARYCAGMGVDMMGFNMDPESDQCLSAELYTAITGWISGVEIVGEIRSTRLPDPELYPTDILQISDPGLIPDISERGQQVILNLDLSNIELKDIESLISDYGSNISYLLLEKEDESELNEVEIEKIRELASSYPIMLGVGVSSNNLDQVIDLGIKAIAIYGSDEERPGFKSYDEMADILEALEVD